MYIGCLATTPLTYISGCIMVNSGILDCLNAVSLLIVAVQSCDSRRFVFFLPRPWTTLNLFRVSFSPLTWVKVLVLEFSPFWNLAGPCPIPLAGGQG